MKYLINNYEITGEYYKEQSYCSYSNGDIGYPFIPAEFEIYEVLSNGINIIDNLTTEELNQLEKLVIKQIEA
jgi:hypothetical protein